MSRSQRPRLRELRAIYLLVGECCEAGHDACAWHARLFEGLRRVIGFQAAFCGIAPPHVPDDGREGPGISGIGWVDASRRHLFRKPCPSGGRPKEPAPDVLCCRGEHFHKCCRRAGLDEQLISRCRVPSDAVHLCALRRAAGEPPFEVRDRRLLLLFHRELAPLIGTKLTPLGESPLAGVPRRQRQVLALLADGHSEKQVARDLGISPHTVHGHVKALHRRLGVSSRAELLAVCPLRLRWHDGPGGSATAAQPWGSR